jgi:hypothetical protein
MHAPHVFNSAILQCRCAPAVLCAGRLEDYAIRQILLLAHLTACTSLTRDNVCCRWRHRVHAITAHACRTNIFSSFGILYPALDVMMRFAYLTPEQGCHTSVTAAAAPLEQLRAGSDGDGALLLYLQPYANGEGHMLKKGPVLGPFLGTHQVSSCAAHGRWPTSWQMAHLTL